MQFKTATTKLLYDLDLKPIEKLLCIDIINLSDQGMDVFITNKTFSERFNVSISTISRSLKALETKGYITVDLVHVKMFTKRYITPTSKIFESYDELRQQKIERFKDIESREDIPIIQNLHKIWE